MCQMRQGGWFSKIRSHLWSWQNIPNCIVSNYWQDMTSSWEHDSVKHYHACYSKVLYKQCIHNIMSWIYQIRNNNSKVAAIHCLFKNNIVMYLLGQNVTLKIFASNISWRHYNSHKYDEIQYSVAPACQWWYTTNTMLKLQRSNLYPDSSQVIHNQSLEF